LSAFQPISSLQREYEKLEFGLFYPKIAVFEAQRALFCSNSLFLAGHCELKNNGQHLARVNYVSRAGYQSGAIKVAEAERMELFTLTDLSPEAILSWFQVSDFRIYNRVYSFDYMKINLEDGSPLEDILAAQDIEKSIYLDDRITNVSLDAVRQNLVSQLIHIKEEKFEQVQSKKIVFNFPKNAFFLKHKDIYYRIDNIQTVITVHIKEQVFPIASVKKYSQVSGDDLASVASIEFSAMEEEFLMSFVRSEKDDQVSVVVKKKTE